MQELTFRLVDKINQENLKTSRGSLRISDGSFLNERSFNLGLTTEDCRSLGPKVEAALQFQ